MTNAARAEAAAALLQALRDVADANDRLQLAAAWTLEAFGDQLDAETVRMLRVPGGTPRPGRPPVPPATPRSVTGDENTRERHPARSPLTFVRDDSGTVHLADESPLGGLVTECDHFGRVTVCEPVAEADLCSDCAEYYL